MAPRHIAPALTPACLLVMQLLGTLDLSPSIAWPGTLLLISNLLVQSPSRSYIPVLVPVHRSSFSIINDTA